MNRSYLDKYYAGGHTIDEMSGNCTSCHALREEMEDHVTPWACPDAHTSPAHAIISMWNVVRADFDKTFPPTPENNRIKAVAIALCRNEGNPPDEIVMGIPNKDSATIPTIIRCGYGTVAIRWPLQPCWAGYVRLAQAAIAACDEFRYVGASATNPPKPPKQPITAPGKTARGFPHESGG